MGRDVPSVFCCLLLSNHGDNFNHPVPLIAQKPVTVIAIFLRPKLIKSGLSLHDIC